MRPKGAFFIAVVIESAPLLQYDKEKKMIGAFAATLIKPDDFIFIGGSCFIVADLLQGLQ